MAKLILDSKIKIVEYNLGNHTWVGRHKKNTIHPDDPQISSEHFLIYFDNSPSRGYILKDLKSRNGTFVNECHVLDDILLRDGDHIRAGDTVWVFKDSTSIPSQMVEVDDLTSQSHIHTEIAPAPQKQFIPEKKIHNDAVLRADYEKLRLTYELQRDIGLNENQDLILNRILERTFEFLHYDHGVVLLAEPDGELKPRAWKSRKEGEKVLISSTVVEHVRKERKGIISTDAKIDDGFKLSQSLIMRGIRSTIAAPIFLTDRFLGVLIIDSMASANAFTEKDLHLITSIANQTAQILSNSILHEELRLSFDNSIKTLAAMVDARHPFTAGHSERVTVFSSLIANEMGIDKDRINVLHFSALLHDIGKIGIPDTVLLKNGRFDESEETEMRTHPVKTRSILEKFHFPQSLSEVPAIASWHHEKIDGTGYPDNLKGESIPMLSRILAVADVFDALSSRRDYPKYALNEVFSPEPMPLLKAVEIIRNSAGTHFDSDVVDAFIRILPNALLWFRGTHFDTEYVDSTIKEFSPGLLLKKETAKPDTANFKIQN